MERDLQKKTPRVRDWGEAIVAIRRRFRERETKMFFWGTCLFVNNAAKRDSKEHKIGFSAYQNFYQHCPDRHAWTEFRYRSKDKAKDIMPLIIRGLRNEKVALGTANEAPQRWFVQPRKRRQQQRR